MKEKDFEDTTISKMETSGNKKIKAKSTSLIAQIIASVWVAIWSTKKFLTNDNIEITDIIYSGFAIASCFSPVYFSLILDKIKSIRFGDKEK